MSPGSVFAMIIYAAHFHQIVDIARKGSDPFVVTQLLKIFQLHPLWPEGVLPTQGHLLIHVGTIWLTDFFLFFSCSYDFFYGSRNLKGIF